jgi:hypothetical protein
MYTQDQLRILSRFPHGKRIESLMRRARFCSPVVLSLGIPALANSRERPSFQAEAKLVNITASVHGTSGQIIGDLTQDDFEVLDDGVPQTIRLFAREAELPLCLEVVIDVRASQDKFIKHLEEIATIVTPDTLMARQRRLIAQKYDGSAKRQPGRPRKADEVQTLVVRMADENRNGGYRRIQGALFNLGHDIARSTIAAILQRHGIEPAPGRSRKTTWKEFLTQHWDLIMAADFFTIEAWTRVGLQRFVILFFIELSTRKVEIAGIASSETLTPAEFSFLVMSIGAERLHKFQDRIIAAHSGLAPRNQRRPKSSSADGRPFLGSSGPRRCRFTPCSRQTYVWQGDAYAAAKEIRRSIRRR